ncbi:hypothetical protein RCL1_004893 [Eukaryota sp. TZLM3-RCL]
MSALDHLGVIVRATTPATLVLILGFLAILLKILEPAAIKQINSFLFSFGLPCLMFRLMSQADFTIVTPNYLIGLVSFKIVTLITSIAVAFILKAGGFKMPIRANIFTIWNIMAWGNTVVLGIPVGQSLFEDNVSDVPTFASLSATVNSLFHIPLSLILAVPSTGSSPWKKVKFITLKVVTNLSLIAVFSGYMISLLKWKVPFVVDKTMEYLANTVIGSSLFCIGMFLASTIKMHKKVQGEKVLASCIPTIDDVGRSTISVDVANEKELSSLKQKPVNKSEKDGGNSEIVVQIDDKSGNNGYYDEEVYEFISKPIPESFLEQTAEVSNELSVGLKKPVPIRRIRSILDEMAKAESLSRPASQTDLTQYKEEQRPVEKTPDVSEHYPVNEAAPVTSSEVPSRAFVDTPALPPTEEELAKDPQEFWYFAMLLFFRLIMTPLLTAFMIWLLDFEDFYAKFYSFANVLPNALAIFTISKQYNIATTSINKMMFYGNILMPFFLYVYAYIFGFF